MKIDKFLEDFCNSDFSEATKPVIWVHIDSWVESEIIHPIIKLFAKEGKYTILMTYSSHLPVKHNLLRDYDYIDYLFSLPVDRFSNAELFIAFAKPSIVIFAISAYCSNYLCQLKKRNIPTFLIATKTVKSSYFFKWHNSSYRNTLKMFTHIFVFDDESKAFLDKLGINNVTVDAYPPIVMHDQKIKKDYHCSEVIEKFIANEKFIFIGGNIDADKDLKLVAYLANTNSSLKCILVPHTISKEYLNRIKYELHGFAILYSECDENTNFSKVQVLVIDFLCDLSYIYRYGSCAYVGGGFTSYLHNVIEATANKLPISFGPRIKYRALPKYLINFDLAQIVRTPKDIYKWEKNLESNPTLLYRINAESIQFVKRTIETTRRIYTFINCYL